MKIYPLTDMVGFDSKPTLFVVATRCRGNRKCISLSDTVKAEARFRVKTKIHCEVTLSEQSNPHPANVKKYLLSRLWNLRGWCNSVASAQSSCFNSQF